MRIAFDVNKSNRNAAERGLPFSMVADFDWTTATFREDTRFQYAERRFVGFGYIGTRLFFLCFTPIEDGIRVISFRKANDRELKRYEQENG